MGSALPADTVASDTPNASISQAFSPIILTGLTDPEWMIAYLTMRSFDLNHQTLKELLPINVRFLSGLPRGKTREPQRCRWGSFDRIV